MPKIGIITCQVLPEPDPDEQILRDALGAAGLEVQMIPWDDPASKPAEFDLCVMRSCWNYYEAPQEFLAWMKRAGAESRLLNGFALSEWNLHKRYLLDLQKAGLPIIPSAFFAQGDAADVRAIAAQNGWQAVVVKPSISAASFATRCFDADQFAAAQEFMDHHLPQRDMMVQKFMPSVQTSGERAMVWIDGAFTHSVLKNPRYAGQDEQVSAAQLIPDEQLEIGLAALAHSTIQADPIDLLYARVDLISDDHGAPMISEFELLEPSLFLAQSPAALKRLVAGIAKAVSM